MQTRGIPACVAAITVFAVAGQAAALESFNTGVDINALVGADALYELGYTGSRAVIANIEAGHGWADHETLGHIAQFIHDQSLESFTQIGEVDYHATQVMHAIGGRLGTDPNEGVDLGIAYGAELWSGAVAVEFIDDPDREFDSGFRTSRDSVAYAYRTAAIDGVNGRTADVITSSWGFENPNGVDFTSASMDAIAFETGKTVVFSAGNSGPGPNTVGAPGSAYNTIAVGALGGDEDPTPYNRVSVFSSRGPNDFFDPITGEIIEGARAAVDISGPGQNLFLAAYGGFTGGHRYGLFDPTNGDDDLYWTNSAGTSFSAPMVAGGAGLLIDVAYDRFAENERARDGRVIKAVLLTGAEKTSGWDNGQAMDGAGVIRTSQSLDYNVGAGRMDLADSFGVFTSGTTDVDTGVRGEGGSYEVARSGWDFGTVVDGVQERYTIAESLLRGETLTATLAWFVDYSWEYDRDQGVDDLRFGRFSNLDLELWRMDQAGENGELIAMSESLYNATEHLHIVLPENGLYELRVTFAGELYDFVGGDSEQFGLAWTVAVPAPASMTLLAAGLFAARRRR
ncbi:MAG: S8 family serine peptidase [Planctomycetota bacterium]